jgi:alkanesulfonate monooxygenase SsuD/methylene tetrahydromethanopterin reductase-like flavin-dependent oxidoreductase (luciferase family)
VRRLSRFVVSERSSVLARRPRSTHGATVHIWVGLPVGSGDWAAVRGVALAAERDGFDGVWVGDHLAYPPGAAPLESWTVLSAVAALTERLGLAAVALSAPLRHPSVVAKAATSLQHVSAGRLRLLVGAGADAAEHEAFGVPFGPHASRVAQAADVLRVCRHLTQAAGAPVDLTGQTVRLTGAADRPPPPAPVALGAAGTGARLRELAVQLADELCVGLVADPGPTLQALGELERSAGRRVRRSVLAPCVAPGATGSTLVGHVRDLAADDLAAQLARYRAAGVDTVYAVLIGAGSYRLLRDRLEQLRAA